MLPKKLKNTACTPPTPPLVSFSLLDGLAEASDTVSKSVSTADPQPDRKENRSPNTVVAHLPVELEDSYAAVVDAEQV